MKLHGFTWHFSGKKRFYKVIVHQHLPGVSFKSLELKTSEDKILPSKNGVQFLWNFIILASGGILTQDLE